MKKKAASYQNGLSSVSKKFTYLLVPMAQYVLKKYINENPPIIATSTDFGKKIAVTDIQTDVNKTELGIDAITAIYNDRIIVGYTKYDDFVITAYTKTRDAAKEWQDQFEQRLRMQNQYRGKCLYAEAGGLEFKEVPDITWDDVVLGEKVKKDIRLNTIKFLGDEKLASAGVTKRGLVMYGPPGTGKTSVVRAIFKELEGKKTSRIYVTAESFRRMSVGHLFDTLKYLGSTVLAFEDIDMVGTSRDISLGSNLLGDLLTNLDGMRKYKDPLVVMASTNKIEMLDDALANRPCRFDRKVEIGLPNDAHLKLLYAKQTNSDVNDDIIKLSRNFTGSHVVETVNTAKILSVSEGKELSDCLVEACNIIRDNFFPGQQISQLKSGIKNTLIKKGHIKPAFNKKASVSNASRIASGIIEKMIKR